MGDEMHGKSGETMYNGTRSEIDDAQSTARQIKEGTRLYTEILVPEFLKTISYRFIAPSRDAPLLLHRC